LSYLKERRGGGESGELEGDTDEREKGSSCGLHRFKLTGVKECF
jgi:hypothetical protein